MEFIKSEIINNCVVLTLSRPEQKNSLNRQLLIELLQQLAKYEDDISIKTIFLCGEGDIFCSGMDLHEIAQFLDDKNGLHEWASIYAKTLKQIRNHKKLVVAKVEGPVFAGGVGLVAACDTVIATEKTFFKLPEAYWGLIPAMVSLYLVRRIGQQRAFHMALTCKKITAEVACEWGLVDIISDQMSAFESPTILKQFFNRFEVVTDEMEAVAIDTTVALLQSERVRHNLDQYLRFKKLPWDKSE